MKNFRYEIECDSKCDLEKLLKEAGLRPADGCKWYGVMVMLSSLGEFVKQREREESLVEHDLAEAEKLLRECADALKGEAEAEGAGWDTYHYYDFLDRKRMSDK
jgi:hypothetical protein